MNIYSMKKLMEMDDLDSLDLNDAERAEIKNWVKKYEKFYNFHDSGNFLDSVDSLTDDCLNQLNLDKTKRDEVKDYLQSLYDLSDGLSVVMAPDPQFQYTNIDQVQRFQY
jgi:hypothetical protein